MIENGNNEIHKHDTLLTIVMTFLNISVLVLVGFVVWSVFSIVENSTAIAQLMNGSFLP